MRMKMGSIFAAILLGLQFWYSTSSSSVTINGLSSVEDIVGDACNGEVDRAFQASLQHPSLRSDARLAHISSALYLILRADAAQAVDMHKLGKSIDPKQMPPLAMLYLDGKTCGGLADIYYLAAVRIKAFVDGGVTPELVTKTHLVLIPLLSDSGLDDAAELHLASAIQLNPEDSAFLFRSTLMTPAVYESSDQIVAVRGLLDQRLKNLTSLGELQLAGVDNFSLATSFYLVYQGYNDKDFLISLHQNYARAYPAYSRDDYTPLHPERSVLTNNAENVPSGDLTQEAIHKGATDNTKPLTKNSIRVGFVSSHLRQHSICKLYCGIITRLKSATSRMFGSNNSVEVFVFSTSKQSREDSTTMHSVLRYAELITTVNLNNATTVQNTFAPAKTGFAIKEFIRVDASIVSNRPLVLSRDIDVLIFLDVGMVPTTNLWAAARLAPVQMVTWGHPSTTGMPHMDYFLSSELYHLDSNPIVHARSIASSGARLSGDIRGEDSDAVSNAPDDSLPRFVPTDGDSYSEQRVLGSSLGTYFERKSVDLPGSLSEDETDALLIERPVELYQKLLEMHENHESLARLLKMRIEDIESETKRMVIVCPQQLPKLHPEFDRVIKDLLITIPNSLFVVIHDDTMKYQWRRTIVSRWNRTLRNDEADVTDSNSNGASMPLLDRVVWVSGMTSQQYLALLAASDLMIDPFPFGGGVTSLEALGVLTPVLTIPELQTVPSLTAGILTRLLGGFQDNILLERLIAHSVTDLVQNAFAFARNSMLLVEARSAIHQFIDTKVFKQEDSVSDLASIIVRAHRGLH